MRKTDMVVFHLEHMEKQLQGSEFGHHDTQFKIVDRVLGRAEEILAEEDSLVNLIHTLLFEVKKAQEESAI